MARQLRALAALSEKLGLTFSTHMTVPLCVTPVQVFWHSHRHTCRQNNNEHKKLYIKKRIHTTGIVFCFPLTVIKTMTKINLGGKSLLAYTTSSLPNHWGNSGRAGIWRQELKQSPAYCCILPGFLSLHFYAHQDHLPRNGTAQRVLPYQSSLKKKERKKKRIPHILVGWEYFLN